MDDNQDKNKAVLHETITIAKFDGDITEGKEPIEVVTQERIYPAEASER
jgi:hypothetical protein